MAAYYFDSSAIVKRYIRETGTDWVLKIVEPAKRNDLFVARITSVEVTSAIVRGRRAGRISAATAFAALAQIRHDIAHQYHVVELTEIVANRAAALAEVHSLRAYDAVQLGTALEIGDYRNAFQLPSLTLVSADQELNAGAQKEGMIVENPNDHP